MSGTPVVAYLIASHTNPSQVVRLVRRIRAERPDAPIVIHHDRSRTPLGPEDFTAADRVRFVDAWVPGVWGTFSLVEQALAGIRALLASGEPFDWLTYLSGQDYPTGSLVAFERGLARCGDGAIVWDDDRPRSRDRYRFAWYRLPSRLESRTAHRVFYVLQRLTGFQPLVRFVSGRIGCRVGVRRSLEPRVRGLRVYKGFQWWTLSRPCVEYAVEFAARRPDVVRAFARRTLVPDEAFFQTVLKAGGFDVVSDDGRFVRWPGEHAMNPAVLGIDDFASIAASGKPFARKFDATRDARILDALDAVPRG